MSGEMKIGKLIIESTQAAEKRWMNARLTVCQSLEVTYKTVCGRIASLEMRNAPVFCKESDSKEIGKSRNF